MFRKFMCFKGCIRRVRNRIIVCCCNYVVNSGDWLVKNGNCCVMNGMIVNNCVGIWFVLIGCYMEMLFVGRNFIFFVFVVVINIDNYIFCYFFIRNIVGSN